MNEKRITRKQFLKAVIAAPALKLIGAGGDFYEIDYENGRQAYRWVDDAGREVWLTRFWIAILNGDIVTLAYHYNGEIRHFSDFSRDTLDIAGEVSRYAIEHKHDMRCWWCGGFAGNYEVLGHKVAFCSERCWKKWTDKSPQDDVSELFLRAGGKRWMTPLSSAS